MNGKSSTLLEKERAEGDVQPTWPLMAQWRTKADYGMENVDRVRARIGKKNGKTGPAIFKKKGETG
jgi:hypothetical protein